MKLLIVTNLLPHYQIDFFNRLVTLYPEIDLTVVADLNYPGSLNSYKDGNCLFKVIHNKMYEWKGLIFRKNILKVIKEHGADKIVIYANPREITLTLVMVFMSLTRVEFYTHGMFHRIGGQRFVSNLYYKLIGLIASKLFTYSRKGVEVLLALGVSHSKIKIIGTAIDEKKSLSMLEQLQESHLEELRNKYNLNGKKIILQVVRLSKIKKPELIIDVAKSISEKRSDCVFVLIGHGEQYDSIKQKICDNGLEGSVHLLGAIYDELELAYWFSMAQVFVIPTCIGLSAHHAFSYGLPIITDDNLLEQASEFDILADGLNSKIYNAGDLLSFENAILRIVDDHEYQRFLSINARKTVDELYSLNAKCLRYINALTV